MADFETPTLQDFIQAPPVKPDAMAHSQPFVAKAEHQETLGFPGELVDNWREKAIERFDHLLTNSRALQVYMDSCVKCGACTDKCHYFLGTGDPKNMPVARQDLLRKVYRRYFTFTGKYMPWLVGAEDLTEDVLDDWYTYFHQCSQCRRCSVFCPYGIDTAEISMAARDIMDHVGKGQKYCNEIIGKVHGIGNNLGLPEKALGATLADLEEEIEEDTGVPVRLPLDEKGAEVMLVTPSADFFAEPHVDGLIGYAKVFHQAGVSWTISSYASEAANFAMFIGSTEQMKEICERIRKAAEDLGVKRIVLGECGHAWRVAYNFWNTLAGPFDFLDPKYPVPQHILEFTHDLIQEGKLKFDKSENDHITVTFHDSCNVARASRMGEEPGGQFTYPREILKAVCNNFVDMAPDTIHENTYCCGGGGGLLTDDLMEIRVKGAKPRMVALKRVTDDHGVTHMAAVCAICKTQFSKVMPMYGYGMDKIVGVHQLLSNAIILDEPEGEDDGAQTPHLNPRKEWTMNDMAENKNLTWRRFEDGNSSPYDGEEKILTAGHSHKCPTYIHRTPPCQGSCPSGHDIRGWLAIARGMDKPPREDMTWQEYAFERMVEANPFPASMGRVCPAPCEDGCNRNEVDDFVGINAVEQYVGDWAIENNLKLEAPETESGKKIAVIGGGPAGMTAAHELRRRGHSVTVFEAHDKLGGMMRYGIPGYRTPRDMVDAEIQRILDMGVEAKTGVKVGEDISIEELENRFDAVFWGIGAQTGRPLPIPGFDAPNCLSGVAFLEAFNKGRLQFTTKKVVVVGGGDTSIDVASVARRLGHIETVHEKDAPENVILGFTAHDVAGTMKREGVQATLTSLFPIEEMTAAEHEREDAKREGVDLRGGIMPLEVIKSGDGRAKALKMCECDMEGMKPVPREGTEFEIKCDMIVSAIGQMGDLTGLEELDNGNGFMGVDKIYGVKDKEKHFAGGDIVRPHLLTTAIGQGRIAAESIDHYLQGAPLDKRPKVDVQHYDLLEELTQRDLSPDEFDHTPTRGTSAARFAVHNYEDRARTHVIPHDELFLGHFGYEARNKRADLHVNVDSVLGNFDERTEGLSEEQAQKEGSRCMSCGMCFECNNCVVFCPQEAVFKVKKNEYAVGRYVDTDYSKCIGCHICMDVCPTGYIQMGLGE